jgi:uncharacterized protein YnzC (UPF0291/DUF896 family)
VIASKEVVPNLSLASFPAARHTGTITSAFPNSEAELLRRVVDPQRAGWSPEAAQSILTLSFSQEDQDRATELAEKAGAGVMTSEEQREMESFRHVGRFLELVKSRARLSLKSLNVACRVSRPDPATARSVRETLRHHRKRNGWSFD